MEVNAADATVQHAHKKEEASDVGSSAKESAQAVAAGGAGGDAPATAPAAAEVLTNKSDSDDQVRTPTSDTAPSVDTLEDGLVRLGITPSPSPPPANPSSSSDSPIAAPTSSSHSLPDGSPSTIAPTELGSPSPAPSSGSSSPALPPTSISPPTPLTSTPGFPRSDYVPPLPGTGMDATNVFIKYLPTDLTNTGLYTLFSQFGEITSCKVMVDPITGYSLGYGFVRFSTAEEATNAINNMYGQIIGNKTLLCKLSHGIPQNNATPSDNLYIKPLLDTTTEADLMAIFSPYGRVLECKVMLDKNTGQSRQIGFVRFATIEEATKALAANNGRYLNDDAPPMVVKYAESRNQKVARRAKLQANQVAAEIRRSAAQLKYQQQQQTAPSDMPEADIAAAASFATGEAVEGASASAAASMPYIVKDEYGNVTFAPEPEQVESAVQAAPAPAAPYWAGRSNGHFEGGGRGARRGGRGGHRASNRPAYQSYHDQPAEDQEPTIVHAPHHPHTVYRKKNHGNASSDHSSSGAPAPSHLHGQASYRAAASRGALPTFHNSTTPRVQLAGKVEVGKHGELVAPEWADDPTRLFISHLPLDFEPSALKVLFELYGPVVNSKISQDKRSPRPKTYGFIQFATAEAAAKAVKGMHGTLLEGRPINVAFEATLSVAKARNEGEAYHHSHQHPHQPSQVQYYPPGRGGAPRGRGGRASRGGATGGHMYAAAPYYPPYMAGEAADAPPYMYMVDPNTGMPFPYPVYFPSVPVPYMPDVVQAEPYYPSNAKVASTAADAAPSAGEAAAEPEKSS